MYNIYGILYSFGGNMTEQIIVSNTIELASYRNIIAENMEKSVLELKRILDKETPLDAFGKMKFDKIVVEPISGKEENIVEVINQLQTYMVSIMAVEYLLEEYPNKSFVINWGNIPGYDIESSDGEIIAECFAATSYRSNGKLAADLKRLQNNTSAKYKYEFFYDKEFTDKQREYYENKFEGIRIIKFYKIK